VIDTTRPVDRTGNPYCGPLVVAAILGISAGAVAAEVLNMRQSKDWAARKMKRVPKEVKGTVRTELRLVV
jgi:hypothetical protein